PAAWEMGGGVEATQVGKIEVEDVPAAIGLFLDGVVVKDDGMTIAAHMHVKFDGVNGQGEGLATCREGIFTCESRAAALGDAVPAVILVMHRRLGSSCFV